MNMSYSVFNPIEHLWSALSDMLARVVFSLKLDSDTKPLCQQSQLSPDELREKRKGVYMLFLIMLYQNCLHFGKKPSLMVF